MLSTPNHLRSTCSSSKSFFLSLGGQNHGNLNGDIYIEEDEDDSNGSRKLSQYAFGPLCVDNIEKLAYLISRFSYDGREEEMRSLYIDISSEIRRLLERCSKELGFKVVVRVAIFCSFTKENGEGKDWCLIGFSLGEKLEEELRNAEGKYHDKEIQKNFIRLYNVSADIFFRQEGSEEELSNNINKSLEYLKKARKFLKEFQPEGDDEKKWKKQNKAWNLLNKAQCYSRLKKERKRVSRLYENALELFNEVGNPRLINTCLERMKQNNIGISNQYSPQELADASDQDGEISKSILVVLHALKAVPAYDESCQNVTSSTECDYSSRTISPFDMN